MVEDKNDDKKSVDVPAKFKGIVESIEKLSVLELSELVKVLEEKFGVSAAVSVASVVPAGDSASAGEAEEEKSVFSVELKDAGGQKIQVIKALRDALGLGLKESKDLADASPVVVKEDVAKAEAEELKKKLEEAGATVELK